MKQYIISFEFEGKKCDADVTEIDGLDDVQYAISPRDVQLAERFRTNIIEKDKAENKWHYAFPSSPAGESYMKALKSGLTQYLGA
jgi:hypothetical protein